MVEPQFKEVKFTVPWGHVAAKTYGPSEGKPVLMVHGRLDNAGSFTRLMKYLPLGTFYYVCIDLPGHGWSSHFPSWLALDYQIYIHALYFILEALGWKKCIYIGHSMGGQIGLMFSALQPHRIEKLIVIDSFLGSYNQNPDFIMHLANSFAYTLGASSNSIKQDVLYTKEEILHALKTRRIYTLNSEAADALFERAVTEVNGKYKYNRDVRLKNASFSFIRNVDSIEYFHKLSVPIYLFIASSGIFSSHMEELKLVLNKENSKLKLQAINVNGNHDVHNNNPENVGPLVCEILISDYSSKL